MWIASVFWVASHTVYNDGTLELSSEMHHFRALHLAYLNKANELNVFGGGGESRGRIPRIEVAFLGLQMDFCNSK